MLVRIVKMGFDPNHIEKFLELFENKKEVIRNRSGCRLLELYRDQKDPTTFFTYSYWDSQEDLDAYRNSDFFKEVWKETKALFDTKPEAWSVDKLVSLN